MKIKLNYLTFYNRKGLIRLKLIMRLTILLSLVAVLRVSATGYSQSTTFSMSMENATLRDVFKEIEKKTDFAFFYNDDFAGLNNVVSIDVKNSKLEDVLSKVLETSSLTFHLLENNFIVIAPLAMAQKFKIKGTIVDENDLPMPGVNVTVAGTTMGVISDPEGKYSLEVVDANSKILFSFVGYLSETVDIQGRSLVNIKLAPDIQKLDEIVVIGYGSVKKSDLTGSVSSISKKDIGDISVTDVSQMIQGKASGVEVINNNGLPGSGTKIKIRGTGTIYNSNPLFVIDGMIGDINDVSSYDIENIEILKDASSTAIYGAQAANGVVMVTTKKGKVGKPKLTYDGYYGMSMVSKRLDLLNASQYMDLVKDIQSNTGTTPLNLTPKLLDPSYVNVDRMNWQDAIFHKAAVSEHHLNVSGGSEKSSYSVSLGYTNQDAPTNNYNYKRYNIMANGEYKIRENIKIGENFSLRYATNSGYSGDFAGAMRMPPYIYAYDPTVLGGYGNPTSPEDINDAANPLSYKNNDKNYQGMKISSQFWVEAELLKGLKIHSQFKYEYFADHNYEFKKPIQLGNTLNSSASLSEDYSYSHSPNLETYLTFNKEFGIHQITAMVGNTYQDGGNSRKVNVSGSGFPSYEVLLPNYASTYTISGGTASKWAYLSYFGRLNYNLLNRYLFTANFRADASPSFAPSNRWGTFPSFAFAWKMHEEAFIKSINAISTLKLRLSWGKSGNDRIDSYMYLSNIYNGWSNNIVYTTGADNHYNIGSTINSLPAPQIRWETSTSTNIAADFGFLDNSILFTAEYYNRLTEGILVIVPIPSSTGIDNAPFKNAASVSNNGLDLQLSYNGNAGDFKYSISAVGGLNANKVESLGEGNPITDGGGITRTDVGQPIGSYYGWEVDHVLVDAADAAAYKTTISKGGAENAAAGDIAYKDLNNDGKIDDKDRAFLGNPNPKFIYGLNLSGNYKGFDLMVSFNGISGNKLYNNFGIGTLQAMERPFNTTTDVLNRWKKEGDITNVPRASAANANKNLRISSRYIEDGSYLRIRSVSLGYTFPIKNNKIIDKLRIYVTGENLHVFTKYKGLDPEMSANYYNDAKSYNMNQGIDQGQFPQPRKFLFGVQLAF